MKQTHTILVLVTLTFIGMIGIYVTAWLAYQKYLEYKPELDKLSNTASSLSQTGNSISGILSIFK